MRALAGGRRVLNLFAYTCSFSVAAALGGAASVTSIDLSARALDWGRDNFRLNELDPDAHAFVRADAVGFLASPAARGQRFELIVLDPPSFSTTKETRFSVDAHYRGLVARVMRVTSDGGSILCATNHRGVVMAKLRRWIHEAAREAGRTVGKMRDLPPPSDFPPVPGMEPHLKAVLVTLAEGSGVKTSDDRHRPASRMRRP